MEQGEDPGPTEPRERRVGPRLVEDEPELAGEALAGERGIGDEPQGQRLRRQRRPVGREAEPRAVARGPEQARRVLDVGERMEDAQASPREVFPPAERIEEPPGARGELDRHRVHAEIAPPEVFLDGGGHHARQRPPGLVALGAGGRHVDPAGAGRLHGGGEEPLVLAQRAAELLGQAPRDGRPVALDDQVEVAAADGRLAPDVADHAADEVGACAVLPRQPPDRREQLARLGGHAPRDPRRRRGARVEHRAAAGNRADRARPPAHDHERRAAGQAPPHGDLPRSGLDHGQRAGHRRRGEIARVEEARAREVLAQDVARAHGEDRRVALPRQRERRADRDGRRRRDDRHVHDVARDDTHLRIRVGTLGHVRLAGGTAGTSA